jgi:putative transposase
MSAQLYKVSLTQKQVEFLQGVVRKGVKKARTITRSRILLLANTNGPAKTDRQIREALGGSQNLPYLVRVRYCQRGVKGAIYDAPRSGQPKKITAKDEAMVTAIACTEPGDGRERWTLDLIREQAEERLAKSIGRSTIHRILLRSNLKPWRKKNLVHSPTD